MHFRQFYLGCLAHASYFIGSRGEAVVVDPQRDVEQYLEEAERAGMRIRYVVETHLHADFVSGHNELAARSGAEIVISADANAAFPHRAVRDGDELRVGSVVLRALATPGHTPESVCWLVHDEDEDAPAKLLTGDTLFIGDAGRPDLAGSRGFTPEQMAGMLYDSLHEKILPLGDDVEVWPAHGAGSACGRNISKERCSTIGVQRATNYALRPMPREEFVRLMTTDLPPVPRYFPLAAEMNRHGASALDFELPEVSFGEALEAFVLDVRDDAAFCVAHIPGAMHIGLDGQFASWAGTLIESQQPIVIVATSPEKASEAAMRLARVGIENVIGYLDPTKWDEPLESVNQISIDRLRRHSEHFFLVDVRRPAEFAAKHVPGALNVPLAELPESLERVPRDRAIAVICQSGYRSSMAASVLRRHGYPNVTNVLGGTQAWLAAGWPTE